jgi:hypothetical protein
MAGDDSRCAGLSVADQAWQLVSRLLEADVGRCTFHASPRLNDLYRLYSYFMRCSSWLLGSVANAGAVFAAGSLIADRDHALDFKKIRGASPGSDSVPVQPQV